LKIYSRYIENAGLAPQHARIIYDPETKKYTLWDIGSKNGIYKFFFFSIINKKLINIFKKKK